MVVLAVLPVWIWAGAAADQKAGAGGSTTVDYARDIKPILSENCFACHGPDEGKRKAGLRLDVKAEALKKLKSGDFAIVPADLAKSAIVERISTSDEDDHMPPAKTGKTLTGAQIDLIKRWVEQGAQWKEHWAFVPPVRPALPKVKDEKWCRNSIDRFILARLEAEGLKPSPEADKATILRRVTFDLTGLPPTLAEIDAFLADESPNAYEKVVDRLLASPHYGERMAQQWLDLARYADTNGYHIDNHRDMWKWREWVIEAFNHNEKFDQFTIEQLAGDLLPNPTLAQKIASGFNRNVMVNFEGGADPDEYLSKYIVDRVTTTCTVFMGITMQCCECHDHKYDPFTTREFYQMYAFFNNVPENGLDGSKTNPVPSLAVPTAEQEKQQKELKEKIAALDAKMKAPEPQIDLAQAKWEKTLAEESKLSATAVAAVWKFLEPTRLLSRGGSTLTKQSDGSVLATGTNPDTDVYEFDAKVAGQVAAIRLEAIADDSTPTKGTGRADNGNFVLTHFKVDVASGADGAQRQPLTFAAAVADYSQANFPVTNAIDADVKSGWAVDGDKKKEGRQAVFVLAQPIVLTSDQELKIRIKFESIFARHAIGRFRLAVAADKNAATAFATPKLSEWSLIGPFVAPDAKNPLDEVHPVEKEINQIELTKKYNDGKLAWVTKPKWKDGVVYNELPDTANGASYLYRTIEVASARPLPASFGSDDGIKVWLNGKLVLTDNAARGAAPDQNKVDLQLVAGVNKLLMKISNFGGPSGFYFKAADGVFGRPANIERIVAIDAGQRSPAEKAELQKYYRENVSPIFAKFKEEMAGLKKSEEELVGKIPLTMVMQDMPKPRETHMLLRGDFRKKGDAVKPAVPAALRPPASQPSDRMGLAQWLVNPEHPLLARVTVNRYWQMYFGTGIVKTTEDFGSQGEWPSHPELLDWLAREFVRSGWDIKAFQKMIVMSSTYRQSGRVTNEILHHDPQNRLLARGPRFRLYAEMIRDNALSISGLLNRKLGGPSISPYESPKLWEEIAFGGGFSAQSYVQSHGDDLYRRGLYIYAKRSMPHPSMITFDAPTREICTVQRPVTNTPLQALLLLNDPIYVEAARVMAQRIIKDGGADDRAKLVYAFRLCTGRAPSERELAILEKSLNRHLEKYKADKGAAEKLVAVGEYARAKELDVSVHAAWTAVCNVMLNMDETISKN